MKELILSVSKGIKGLFRDKINIAILLAVSNLVIMIVFFVFITKLSLAIYLEIMSRIDHTYLKSATTTEEIFDVKINKDFDGRIESDLTESQKLDLIKSRMEAQSKIKERVGLRKYLKELKKPTTK